MTDSRTKTLHAAVDCPACPSCKATCGVPIRGNERFYGPAESRLLCPACGTGWYGADADVAKAEQAQHAWEMAQEAGWA